MRVFTAVRHSKDPRFYYGGLWSGNFYPALRQLGHEIAESQIDLFAASRFIDVAKEFTPEQLEVRARITQDIIDEVTRAHKEKPVDVVLSYFYNSHFDPTGFDVIHKLGIRTINFYCNNVYQFDLVSDIARRVQFSWHPEKNARALYLKVGANPVWVQMGADPAVYHPSPGITRLPKACFVGQRYCDRDRWLASLARHGIPFDIYGSGWNSEELPVQRNGSVRHRDASKAGSLQSYFDLAKKGLAKNGWLNGSARVLQQGFYTTQTRRLRSVLTPYAKGQARDVSETFSKYEVVLNFSNVWADGRSGSRLIPHVRLRDFEAPMSRACYLTGHTEEIAEFYELEKEIITYRSREEFVDKTRYYLNNPEDAERVREAGYQRALRDHTWTNRFKELFAAVGLEKSADCR